MQASKVEVGQHFKLATDKRVLKRLAYDNGVYGVDENNNLVGIHPDSSCELATGGEGRSLKFSVKHHETNAELTGRVEVRSIGIDVFFDGFGTHNTTPGFGPPLYIEPDKHGQPVLFCWSEIDSEDHTHKISLHGARDNRTAE